MLQNEFASLVARHTTAAHLAPALWQGIESAYTAEGRHFHNFSHLQQMLAALAPVQTQMEDRDAVLFALFYHDYVYDVVRYVAENDNEERSAAEAGTVLATLGLSTERIERCKRHILATKAHKPSADADTNLLTDADLSVLGQPWEAYEAYMKAIRREFEIYPDSIYHAGRINVLKNFLRSKRLFKTDYFHQKFEAAAKENVARELEILSLS